MSHSNSTRWMMLGLLALAECLAISLWMTASSVTGQLSEHWSLTAFQSGWLTTSVQVGFVVGAALLAITNVADLVANRKLFALSAVAAAFFNSLIIWFDSYLAALVFRFLTGFFLAGVYPPGMKMIATWFKKMRGFAIGTLVGALTIGKASPWFLKWMGTTDWQWVVGWSSLAALLSALMIAVFYRPGPNQFERKPFSWSLVGQVLRHRPTRLATFGYLGHMWELYAMWTWVPIFLAAAATSQGVSQTNADLAAFLTIAAGAIGCVAGGLVADKLGRASVVNGSMILSGGCCLMAGLAFGNSFWLLVAITVFWGIFVVADSAQFSAMVTEVAPQHAVGTALSIQTSLGFLLTTVTIQLVPVLQHLVGWRYAFAVLAIGPAFGVWSIRRMKSGN